jgi:hypothetical protein
MNSEALRGSTDDRLCAWCKYRLPIDKRQNAKTCSKKCRQASWRFGVSRVDTLDDLFPGSGAVSFAWARFTRSDL